MAPWTGHNSHLKTTSTSRRFLTNRNCWHIYDLGKYFTINANFLNNKRLQLIFILNSQASISLNKVTAIISLIKFLNLSRPIIFFSPPSLSFLLATQVHILTIIMNYQTHGLFHPKVQTWLNVKLIKDIIPSYSHLPASCKSLVDRCGSLGSFKPHF